jgi:Protein of unknown function (DUF3304)
MKSLEAGRLCLCPTLKRSQSFAVLWLLMVGLSACSTPADSAPTSPALHSPSEGLLLQGYNYTDHFINSYSVNGQGGGNIFESSPESGGGKSACCISWLPGTKLPVKIKVRWTASYCMKLMRTEFGDYEKRQDIYNEQDAWITEAVAEKPRALEVHFYRDGRIEAAVTHGDSPPRLKLPRENNRNRPGVSQEFPRCPNDTK